jgi:hypothetical protein
MHLIHTDLDYAGSQENPEMRVDSAESAFYTSWRAQS